MMLLQSRRVVLGGRDHRAATTRVRSCCAPARRVARVAQLSVRASAAAAAPLPGGGGGSSLGGLAILQNTRPVDRLRFQAILVFQHFDTEKTGRLSPEQLTTYEAYSAERFGAAASEAMKPAFAAARAAAAAVPGGSLDMEAFIDLIRDQVKVAATSREFPRSVFPEAELGKLAWGASLSTSEMASALAIFRLLDFNLDGYVKLEDLRRAQGIEREFVNEKLEDADTNEDGFLSFKDFLTSYARERPVILNMLVLLAHTAAFWVIFNLPGLDLPVKAIMAMGLMLKPQFVTGPVIKIYTIFQTIFNRARAEVAMAQDK
ncbi:hypothetical protein HYH02_003204 [Chlamydomonas schloesseri]|uniref:EF-hand domain-containing protein n=1 Tax=Chlamydomonas schloesseri TaxID=2026947 RepID=A0A835WQR3_9CHLO|nr:hypothetical protein HYH02_003204 [Chlamydomonas schloesseri]|eukprot:KAG2452172.1 hypothetical protein HYH02_003204 [Chlamydomonas schloesseri]